VRIAYVALMEQLETLQIRLSNYIKRNYPNEKSWLNDNRKRSPGTLLPPRVRRCLFA
jgi:hypothetical protein